MPTPTADDQLRFLHKIQRLLESGRFTSTTVPAGPQTIPFTPHMHPPTIVAIDFGTADYGRDSAGALAQ